LYVFCFLKTNGNPLLDTRPSTKQPGSFNFGGGKERKSLYCETDRDGGRPGIPTASSVASFWTEETEGQCSTELPQKKIFGGGRCGIWIWRLPASPWLHGSVILHSFRYGARWKTGLWEEIIVFVSRLMWSQGGGPILDTVAHSRQIWPIGACQGARNGPIMDRHSNHHFGLNDG